MDDGYLHRRYGGLGLAAEFIADKVNERVVGRVCCFEGGFYLFLGCRERANVRGCLSTARQLS